MFNPESRTARHIGVLAPEGGSNICNLYIDELTGAIVVDNQEACCYQVVAELAGNADMVTVVNSTGLIQLIEKFAADNMVGGIQCIDGTFIAFYIRDKRLYYGKQPIANYFLGKIPDLQETDVDSDYDD